MHIHTVYFWLQEDLTTANLGEFEQGLKSLLTILHVREGYWGKPAGTPREVVDNSYAYSLTMFFKSTAEHDSYQVEYIMNLWLRTKRNGSVYRSMIHSRVNEANLSHDSARE
jgi:hypothetical protein